MYSAETNVLVGTLLIRYNYKAASRTLHVASIFGTLRQFKRK
jgi:hypothetical protein